MPEVSLTTIHMDLIWAASTASLSWDSVIGSWLICARSLQQAQPLRLQGFVKATVTAKPLADSPTSQARACGMAWEKEKKNAPTPQLL